MRWRLRWASGDSSENQTEQIPRVLTSTDMNLQEIYMEREARP
jgi:hypothetical protein